jgi:hypothetical protein
MHTREEFVSHGLKVKRCSFEGCTNRVIKELCLYHPGAKRKSCSFDGCPTKPLREVSVSHMVPRGNDETTMVLYKWYC